MPRDPIMRERLDALEARRRLNEAADEALELALRDRLSLGPALRSLLPLLATHTGAQQVWVRTFDEDLELRDFRWGGELCFDPESVMLTTDRGEGLQRPVADGLLVAQPLDVAGEIFGAAGVVIEKDAAPRRTNMVADLLNVWCEELDNYLASIARAREKERIGVRIGEALEEPLLDVGVNRALTILQQELRFDSLLLVFRNENEIGGASLHYKIIEKGELTHDSRSPDMEVDEFVRSQAPLLIQGESRALLDRFGLGDGRQEVLIAGLRDRQVLGRLVVTKERTDFNTFDRDILDRFTSVLRRRLVDFSREWKRLSRAFSAPTVRRLLQTEDHQRRFLAPREADAAVLFCDISGFTRISEQVLREPSRIGALVDEWSRQAVAVIWESDGVFDKMVGDCIIGLWGPPFFEMDASEACQRALASACAIREITEAFANHPDFPELASLTPPITVSTGIHYCPLCVGLFGPNENYTGFSSGMNSTARLQAVAEPGEVLCMETVVDAIGDSSRFGEPRETTVKNVSQPLRHRVLRKQ